MLNDFVTMAQEELSENGNSSTPVEKDEKTSEKNEIKTPKKIENASEGVENAENMDSDNTEKTPETNSEKKQKNDSENSEKNNEEAAENLSDNALEGDDEEDIEEDEIEEEEEENEDDYDDDEMDDLEEEEDEIDETEEDPLDEFADTKVSDNPPKMTIEEIPKPISKRHGKVLEKLGLKSLEKVDHFKARMCSKISGQHMAEYVADSEMQELVLEAIKEYLETQEVSAPSPAATLLLTLAMWTLPPIGLALFDKYEMQAAQKKFQAQNSNNPKESAAQPQAEQKTDYSHLKEYQDKRKVFTINKTKGTYNRTPSGTFIKLEIANEKPSPLIQEWLDLGYTSRQIREILDHGG